MSSNDQPIYISKPTWHSLKQTYYVYPDRVELEFKLGRTFVIPQDDIVVVDVRYPPVARDLIGGHPQFNRIRALKLDLADLNDHVALVKESGFWQQLRFTPDNPREFVEACKSIVTTENFIQSW